MFGAMQMPSSFTAWWDLHVIPVSKKAWDEWVAARQQMPVPQIKVAVSTPNDWEEDLELE